jgi:outer membrane protein assembly factor BamA
MKLYPTCLFIVFLIACTNKIVAQTPPLQLSFFVEDSFASKKVSKLLKEQGQQKAWERNSIKTAVNNLYTQLLGFGYFETNFQLDTSSYHQKLFITLGPQYQWLRLENGNLPNWFIKENPISNFNKKAFSQKDLQKYFERIITSAEQSGYPFASFWLDSLIIAPQLAGRVYGQLGKAYKWGGIQWNNLDNKAPKLRLDFLYQYLSIAPNEVYTQSKAKRIQKLLNELPFVQLNKDPLIWFEEKDSMAYIVLDVKTKNANRFDGIVGFQPQANANGGTNLGLTGNLNLDLLNIFGGAERLKLEWQQLRPETQNLKIQATAPYILPNMPIGVDGTFELYKRDTSYLDLNASLGLQFSLAASQYIKFFWETRQTNLLSVNKPQIIQSKALPSTLDTRTNIFGFSLNWQQLDYQFNPRKGYKTMAKIGYASRTVLPNNTINDLKSTTDPTFNFASLYSLLPSASNQIRLEWLAEYYWPLSRNTCFKSGIKGGALAQPTNSLSLNELYRIGGTNTIRGFDAESLYSNLYNVTTAELRLLFSTNSYFSVFADWAYVQSNSRTQNLTDQLIGFGAGLALETKIGIFGISYALGSSQQIPLELKNAKVHFGYVNLF